MMLHVKEMRIATVIGDGTRKVLDISWTAISENAMITFEIEN